MRARDVFRSLAGSAVVYVAMAACSSGGGGSGTAGQRTAGAGGGAAAGASVSSGASGATGMLGAGGATGASGASGASGAGSAGGTGAISDSGLVDALMNPVPTASADPTDGQRLRATWRQGSDGSKEYVNGVWFDSQRSETCAFMIAGDGTERCLPEGMGTSVFADAACMTPVLTVPSGCAAPMYATSTAASACGLAPGGTHIFTVGAAVTPSTIYAGSAAQCFNAGPATSGFNYLAVGAEIPASTFVGATSGHD
jgi:hypothetical protein